jgi:hypothetical protein
MKKLAASLLIAFLGLNTSQAKTMSVDRVLAYQQRMVTVNRTAMKSALVHAIPRAQRRLLATNLTDDENDNPPGPDELDLQVMYRRPRIVEDHKHFDADVSDYVTIRLAVARARAMQKYYKNYTVDS